MQFFLKNSSISFTSGRVFSAMLILFVFVINGFYVPKLRADYTDENGVRRVGPPGSFPPGYRDESGVYRPGDPPPGTKVLNGKGKVISTPEKLPAGTKPPDKYGEDTLRVIQNKLYDFSAVATWANEYAYLLSVGPKPLTPSGLLLPKTSTKTNSSKAQISDWDERWKQNQAEVSKYGSYFLAGKVRQVVSDGIIIDAVQHGTTSKQPMILKNYPQKDQIADGDMIEVLALPSGLYTNKSLGQHTIHLYDFGRPSSLEDSELEKVSVP